MAVKYKKQLYYSLPHFAPTTLLRKRKQDSSLSSLHPKKVLPEKESIGFLMKVAYIFPTQIKFLNNLKLHKLYKIECFHSILPI